jgi:hypothetical protein
MIAAPPIDRSNVVYLVAAAAPRMNACLRHVLAMSMVNPKATPDTLFCLADAWDEFAKHAEEFSEQLILAAALYHHAIGEARALAQLCRARGEQLAAA